LKPSSVLELSVQAKSISRQDGPGVAVKLDGASGVGTAVGVGVAVAVGVGEGVAGITNVVALATLEYAESPPVL
jgi:hypothetical protein